MEIHEITIRHKPDEISFSGGEKMRAYAGNAPEAKNGLAWIKFGPRHAPSWKAGLKIFFEGDGAHDKASRIAAAINAVLDDETSTENMQATA